VVAIDKGFASFETESVNTDLRLITGSRVILEFLRAVVPNAEPEAWLRKQLLVSGDQPTVAAVLVFGDRRLRVITGWPL
jgi:ATP-dependent DNA helicase RecG